MNLKEYVKAIWELSGFCMILCLCQLNLIDTFSEHLWHLWHLCLWFRTGQDDTLQSAWHWPQGHHLDGNDTFIGTNQIWPTFYDICNSFATVSQQFRNSFATVSQQFRNYSHICTMHFCISGSFRFFPAFLSSSVLRVSSSMLKCVPKESVACDGGSTVQRTLWTLQTLRTFLTDLGTDAARCLPNF